MFIITLSLAYIFVVLTCRLGERLAPRLGQPVVIGEIAAGLVLGPSVVGALWPAFSVLVFIPATIKAIGWLGDAGAVVFLFLLGTEFDSRILSRQPKTMVLTTKLAFIALACSLTALPVLACILDEQHMMHSDIGQQALACAVLTDAVSWLLLSIVVLVTLPHSGIHGVLQLAAIAGYFLISIGPIRQRCKALGANIAAGHAKWALPELALYLLASTTATAALGLHALLGAFAVGLILPRDVRIAQALQQTAVPFYRWLLPCLIEAPAPKR